MKLHLTSAIAILSLCACTGADNNSSTSQEEALMDSIKEGLVDIPMKELTVGNKTYNVADLDDSAYIYNDKADKDKCLFVISKKEFRLYVYECSKEDTTLVAHFPVCYARYPEAKEKSGDMRTPESSMDAPFKISQIQPASDWCHDFGDGRGSIKSYGDWFLRLETPGFSGVGIHGSTNNEASVPGRDSEGCIRLRDKDLIDLHDKFAKVGMPVVIKSATEGTLDVELHAEEALNEKYHALKLGNPRLSNEAQEVLPNNVIPREE